MKRIFIITIVLMAITACTGLQFETAEPTATIIPPLNMPNPASVYCEKNGYTLEIRTAANDSQSGVCVFPDGSTCDEWAYYREECGPEVENSPTSATTLEATTEVGGGSPGGNASGGYMQPGTTEELADWWGVIKSNAPGAEFDDCFERQDLGQVIYFGIDSKDPAIESQIIALRNSGKIVHLYGTLVSNVPDCNGSQVLVDRIEEQASGGYIPPGTSEEIADWRGVIKSTAPGSQYDDYFELWTNGQIIYFGIDSMDPAVQAQIEALCDSGKIVHLYGTLFSNVPDYNGSQIQVTCPPKTDPKHKLGSDLKKGYTVGKAGKEWPRRPLQPNKSSAS